MVCSMSHVVWHAEGMESVAGTDGNVVKKPGCMQMIFWDYYGLQVDTNKKPLNNTWACSLSFLLMDSTGNTSNLMTYLRVNHSRIHSEIQMSYKGRPQQVSAFNLFYLFNIYIATLIWGYMYMYIEILNCQYHPTQCKTQFHMREQSTSKWNFIMYMWASTR